MHVLQAKAKKYNVNGKGYPENAQYDFVSGVWRNHDGLVAFQEDNGLASKKNDLETGEDQKGE